MEIQKKYTQLNCEQIYNVWSTDPHLIQILDLRSPESFASGHIPGAIHTSKEDAGLIIQSLGDRLAVLVVDNTQKAIAETLSTKFSNCVILSDCERWRDLKKPIAGDSIDDFKYQLQLQRGTQMNNDILFQQLFEPESSTYSYIIADKKTKEAALIDPVLETVDRDLKLIDELGLKLIYVLDTHIHADHITGAGEIRKRTQAKTAVSRDANVSCVDIPLEDGQELRLGNKKIKVIATPGHTDSCLTYAFENMIFTGDALLIRGCGRTDFQQGSSEKLFHSVQNKLFQLPDDTIVYPGHDYRGLTSSTIGAEKNFNPRLGIKNTLDDFKKIMSELKLSQPKKINEAVPANLACGTPMDQRVIHPQIVDGVPEVTCEDVNSHAHYVSSKKLRLIDVRRPDEFNNELGHILGAELVTLGEELTDFLKSGNRNEEIVFVCRSGGRSGTATTESQKLGYKKTANMVGGMIRWNELKFKTEKK